MRFLPFLPALLAVLCAAGAVSGYRQAPTLWHIDRSVGLAVLAALLTGASIRTALNQSSRSTTAAGSTSAVSVGLIFGASLMTIWAGCGMLFETLELCNQEYLHWFPRNQLKMFPIRTGFAITIMATVGTLLLGTGLFMYWFLFFRRRVDSGVAAGQVVETPEGTSTSDSSPYRAPQQTS